ncbi:hypothetical protein [Acinetobacter junii]|nr:hypothetical protein [Acinetobacter junii]
MTTTNNFKLLQVLAGNEIEKAAICELLQQAGLYLGVEMTFTPPCLIATSKDGAVYTDFPITGEDQANITIIELRELVNSGKLSKLNLTTRQQQVLQCVMDASLDGIHPYTWHIVKRMSAKGYEITEKQCSYDLGVIIRTKGTGVYSMKCDNRPKLWIYEAPKVEVKS